MEKNISQEKRIEELEARLKEQEKLRVFEKNDL